MKKENKKSGNVSDGRVSDKGLEETSCEIAERIMQKRLWWETLRRLLADCMSNQL